MRVVRKRHDRLGGSQTHPGDALQLPERRVVLGESRPFLFDAPQLNAECFDFIDHQIPLNRMHRLREFKLLQPCDARAGLQPGASRRLDRQGAQQRPHLVLGPRPFMDQFLPKTDQLPPSPHVGRGDVNGGNLVDVQ